MSTVEPVINKHSIAMWFPFPLPASAGARQEPPCRSLGLDGAARATGAAGLPNGPAAAPRQHTPGVPLIRYVLPIRLINQTSFLRATEPFWGRAGNGSVRLPPAQAVITHQDTAALETTVQEGTVATAGVHGHAMLCGVRSERPEGLVCVPPGSNREPRTFPAPFGEITRGERDGKLLMRLPCRVLQHLGLPRNPDVGEGGWGGGCRGTLVPSAPLLSVCCGWGSPLRTLSSVSVSPQGPEEQPDQHSAAGRLPRPPRAEAPVSASAAPPGSTRGWRGGSGVSGASPAPTAPPLASQGPLQQPHRLPERQRLPGAPQPPQAVSSSLGTPWPAPSPGSQEEPPPWGIAGSSAPRGHPRAPSRGWLLPFASGWCWGS